MCTILVAIYRVLAKYSNWIKTVTVFIVEVSDTPSAMNIIINAMNIHKVLPVPITSLWNVQINSNLCQSQSTVYMM